MVNNQSNSRKITHEKLCSEKNIREGANNKTKVEKIKIALTFILIIAVIGGGLYWISVDAEKSKEERIRSMKEGYNYAKGIIVRMHYYKGQTIRIKYKIDGMEYVKTRNWDGNPRNLSAGDSIQVKYATHDPNLIICELERDY